MKNIIFSFFAGLIGSILFFILHTSFYPKQNLGSVNLAQIYGEHIQNYGQMSAASRKEAESKAYFARDLEAALLSVSKRKNVGLLVSGAVIGGLDDYTGDVKEELKALDAR